MGIERESKIFLPQNPNIHVFQLTHKLSALRASLKSITVSQVHLHFNSLPHERRKQLLEDDEYWYKLSAVRFNFP